jgi:hypothetical protein
MAHWFTQHEAGGFPVEKARLGDCDLSILHGVKPVSIGLAVLVLATVCAIATPATATQDPQSYREQMTKFCIEVARRSDRETYGFPFHFDAFFNPATGMIEYQGTETAGFAFRKCIATWPSFQ